MRWHLKLDGLLGIKERLHWSSLPRPVKLRWALYGAGMIVAVGGLIFTLARTESSDPPAAEKSRSAIEPALVSGGGSATPARIAGEGESASWTELPVDVTGTRLTSAEQTAVARGGESLDVRLAPPGELSSVAEVGLAMEAISSAQSARAEAATGLLGENSPGARAFTRGGPLERPAEKPRRAEDAPGSALIDRGAVPEDPPRAEVIYQSGGHRDPFRSLIRPEEESDSPLLDLVGARLVGVAWNDDAMLAMVEDHSGRSYALRPGDKVRSGRLARVTHQRAVFELWLYGRTESRVLELARGEGEEE